MKEKEISQEEINVYDRQIRLWGIQAQKRIRNSSVLLIHIRELAEEIAKNLVLSGIGTLTLLDDGTVEKIDSKTQFCIGLSDIGMNYADVVSRVLKEFNPSVTLEINTTPLFDVSDDYFSGFDVVIATELELDLIVSMKIHCVQSLYTKIHLNTVCRAQKVPFYTCAMYGFYGYIFVDLIKHTYSIEKKASGRSKKTTRIEYTEQYHPFPEVVNHEYGKLLTEKHAKKVSQFLPGIIGKPVTVFVSFDPEKGLLCFQKRFSRFPAAPDEMSHYLSLVRETAQRLALSDQILKDSDLIHLAENAAYKWPPVASVIGGVLAQDVLNVLSSQERPIQNWFIFDGEKCMS
ncbi:E1 ubiquitin-activating protein AOS1 [Pneumocystis jirovecii RU7]|uniref:THIF-type NAD/FAD binding fold domain-containing protein n=1 Tax=Pneumocystis jirovecii (strain RU7) TaxID=1408657 RepID=A0A0W4ZIU9_PNEJ7|nr:E1 ubiquitin-activating protein AOS1 [Pneumocystis jirovecii RU7]KTW28290.1 hypothetical protein T551_02709 [Pneumocystis jirovecii RU7]